MPVIRIDIDAAANGSDHIAFAAHGKLRNWLH